MRRDIYDIIIDGIKNEEGLNDIELIGRLVGLQSSVKKLRSLYRNYPVCVPYDQIDIQAAYLISYFPHYYQLIYKILLEKYPSIFNNLTSLNLVFFGGGPGPEIYGVLKFISNNNFTIKDIDITILDINAKQWEYSHNILKKHIIPSLGLDKIELKINSRFFDLAKPIDLNQFAGLFNACNLLVFQNCLNEIPVAELSQLKINVQLIIKQLPLNGSVIINDLTGGYAAVQSLIQSIEKESKANIGVSILHTSLITDSFQNLTSIHARPSYLVSKHLLTGSDGLIPRKYLKYNFSFFSKSKIERRKIEVLGLSSLYSPLNFDFIDADNLLKEKSYVGIDFGTSTTVVSLAKIGEGNTIKTEPIEIGQKCHEGYTDYFKTFDSVIALTENRLLFGKHAAELKNELQKNIDIWHTLKLELGNNNIYESSRLKDVDECRISNTNDAISLFFRYLKKETDKYIEKKGYPKDIEYAICIPAAFKEKQRKQLLTCIKMAGIATDTNPFIDEPIAAFINYMFENKGKAIALDSVKNLMVVDIGAGTCDISIFEIGDNDNGIYAKNLSITQYGNIGGEKLDYLLAKKIFKNKFHINENENSINNRQLISIAEELKRKLCRTIDVDENDHYKLPLCAYSDLPEYLPEHRYNRNIERVGITYKEFNEVMEEYCGFSHKNNSSISASINGALRKADLDISEINYVLLTGGGSRNPYFKSILAREFKNAQLLIPDNIQEHVAGGTAIHSLILNAFGQFILQPVLVDDIYIENNGKLEKIFKAGCEVPTQDYVMKVKNETIVQSKIEIPIIDGNDNSIAKVLTFNTFAAEEYKVIIWFDTDKTLNAEVISSIGFVPCKLIDVANNYQNNNYFIKL